MSKRAIRFGRADHLVGVVHEALNPEQGTSSPAIGVILWNTGISNRCGPYRLNVEIADMLARQGLTVLRFDLTRLGDSDDSGEKISFQDCATRDLADALELLARDYQLASFVLIGLCSSAVDAYYFARTEPRVSGLFMVDTFVYPTTGHRLLRLWQRATSLSRWKSWLARRLWPAEDGARPLPSDIFEANYPHPLQARDDIKDMLQRGVRMLVIYTGGFAAYFSHKGQFPAMLGASEFAPGLELLHWPETDHLFTMLEDREQLKKALGAWLQKHFPHDACCGPDILHPTQPTSVDRQPLIEWDEAHSHRKALLPSPKGDDDATTPEKELHPPLPTDPIAVPSELLVTQILSVFREVLATNQIDAEDSFFDFGGTSLLAIRSVERLSALLGRDISIVALYGAPTARGLAYELSAEVGRAATAAPAPEDSAASQAAAPASESVAIIGMACDVPGAKTWQELWTMIVQGESGIRTFTAEEIDPSIPAPIRLHPNYVRARGVIEGDRFDAAFFGIKEREALFMDPQQRILLQTAWQALEDGGYSRLRRALKIAVYAGVSDTTYLNRNIFQGHALPHSQEEYAAGLANDKDFVATRIAYALDLKGPAISIHTACSTSLVAVIEAVKTLLAGDADLALAGGASVEAPMASGHLYQEGSIFSRDGSCRPFAADATGTMFSDGAAVVLLKRLSDAVRDGDHIYAVIRSWGLSNDGSDKSSFAAPSARGQAAAISQALRRSAWSGSSVGYVECHGTATPIGDPIEVEGLRRAFDLPEGSAPHCALGSVKANIGHLTAAAGAIGLMKTALVLKEGLIPPARGAFPLNKALRLDQGPFYVPSKAGHDWPQGVTRRAGVSSFGVGGTNAHVLLEAYTPRPPETPSGEREDPWITYIWSGADPQSCQRMGQLLLPQDDSSTLSLGAISSTLWHDRETLGWRQAAVGFDRASLAAAIIGARCVRAEKGPIVLLFPGQGSQYPRMGLGLAARWPRFARYYAESIQLFKDLCQLDLLEIVSAEAAEPAQKIHETLYTQCALFCLEWSLAKSMLDLGVKPDAMIGHSLGELSAAAIAGVFTLDDAVRVVHARASAMQAAPAGSMLSVSSSWEALAPSLEKGLSLAVRNSPRAIVIAGPTPLIEKTHARLSSEGFAARRLATSHAFHSSMMEGSLASYRRIFAGIRLEPPRIPLYSTLRGRLLSHSEATSADYWIAQMREPVDFCAAIAALPSSQIPPTFVEIGPKAALTRFLPAILAADAKAFATLGSGDPAQEMSDCAVALGALCAQGYEIAAPERMPRTPAPVYPFSGPSFWLRPKPERTGARAAAEKDGPDDIPPPRHGEASKGQRPASQPKIVPPPEDALMSRLKGLLSALSGLPPAELALERDWTGLGLDSLLLTQWALTVQKEFRVDLSLQQLQTSVPHLNALGSRLVELRPDLLALPSPSLLSENRPSQAAQQERPMSHDAHLVQMSKLLERQNQLIERQTQLIERLLQRAVGAAVPQESASPEFWHTLPIDGEIELHSDRGRQVLPFYRGAFVAQDEDGQPALFIEDPERKGEYWQIAAEAGEPLAEAEGRRSAL